MTMANWSPGEKYTATMWKSKKCVMCYGWGMDGFAWSTGAWHQNIALETLHISMGDMFQGSDYLGIETCVGLPLETWHVLVHGKFWVSLCLGIEMCDDGPWKLPYFDRCYVWGMPLLSVKIGTKLPSKHDMFWCWFTQWFMLPVHQNSH